MNAVKTINSQSLIKENSILKTNNSILENENSFLKEQLEWFKRQLFGKSSEKIVSNVNSQQLEFQGFSNIDSEIKEETKNISSHTRRKAVKGKDKIKLSPDLPVETTVLDIPKEEKTCKETGLPLKKIGEEISHKLAHKPGSFYIKEIIRIPKKQF